MEFLVSLYMPTLMIMGAIGALLLLQLLVADVAGILRKHVPGTQVTADHGDFLFRAVRAHANTNESVPIFILLALSAMLTAGPASWVNGGAFCYLVGRIGHMCCYYANWKIPRSVFFVVSIVGLFGLLRASFNILFL